MQLSFNSSRLLFYSSSLLILIVLFTTVLFNLSADIASLEENERKERQASFDLAMQRINSYVDLLRARVKVVAYQESDSLHHLFNNPNDLDAEQRLHKIAQSQLPDMFAISLAGPAGNVVLDDFDGKVGESCRKNIRHFTETGGEYRILIHPNSLGYHFDIMVPFMDDIHDDHGTFFVSFRVNTLAKILRESALSEHQLMLLLEEQKDLIEVHAQGGRFDMKRPTLLSTDELSRLSPVSEVSETHWQLANLIPTDHLRKRLRQVVLAHIGYLILLIVLAVFSLLAIRREQHHSLQLQKSHDRLEELVTERTKELEQAHIQTNSLVENASDGIINIDEKQNIVLFNPAAEKIFQYRKEDVLGQPLTKLLPDDAQPRHHKYVTEFGDDTETHARIMESRSEIQGKRQDGSLFPAEASICKSKIDDKFYFTAFVRDITQRNEAEAKIRRLAMHDSLTGLANRHHFDNCFKQAIAYHNRFPDHKICLLLLDLDRFKQVNDTFGHAIGDALLKLVAEILQSCVRNVDTVGRLGGDEFAILLQGVESTEHAVTVARKLIQALSTPHLLDGHTIEIGASIGITFYPEFGTDPEQLFKQADEMLYASKAAGRNTYRIYSLQTNERD